MISEKGFEERSVNIIEELKKSKYGENRIPIQDSQYFMLPISYDCCDNKDLIKKLANWRKASQHAFTKIFNITFEGTARWLNKGVLERRDRILFLVVDNKNQFLGHIGISSFDFENESCEIDNVVKKPSVNIKALFYNTSKSLIQWIQKNIEPKSINLRVLHDNTKALALYHRLNFIPTKFIPLQKIESENKVEWVDSKSSQIDRFFILMTLQ